MNGTPSLRMFPCVSVEFVIVRFPGTSTSWAETRHGGNADTAPTTTHKTRLRIIALPQSHPEGAAPCRGGQRLRLREVKSGGWRTLSAFRRSLHETSNGLNHRDLFFAHDPLKWPHGSANAQPSGLVAAVGRVARFSQRSQLVDLVIDQNDQQRLVRIQNPAGNVLFQPLKSIDRMSVSAFYHVMERRLVLPHKMSALGRRVFRRDEAGVGKQARRRRRGANRRQSAG